MATIGVKIELEGAPQYKENMQNLTAQTKLYQAQIKRLQTEMKDGVSAYTKSITMSKALQQQLDAQTNQSKLLEEQIQKSIEKYGEDSTQVIRLKTQYENLQAAIAKTTQDLKAQGGVIGAISAEFKAVGEKVEQAGQKISQMGDKVSALGSSLSRNITAPLTALGAASVKTAADFDSSMSQVAATMGYTVSELSDGSSEASKTMEQLSNFAQEMGKSTAFSASEAAEALNYMALAGYDAETSMKMLPTVLDLASAGGIGLAEASDMVTDAQSALGLSIEDTTKMVDQMAKASSKSNTSVAQLGQAILTIGATASNVSGGTTELATSLGVLADNGIKGAEGGTHLRNMILSLQDAAIDGAVDFGEFSVQVYDAEGNFRAISDIMMEVSKNMEGMSQESKDAITSGVFNKTDLASVNAMLNTSADRFADLKNEIENAEGAASDMAAVQLDNLNGQITLLKSALEGVAIQIGEIIMPYIQQFVDKVSELVDWFSSLDSEMQETVVKIAAVAAAIGPALIIVGKVGSLIGGVVGKIGALINFIPTIITAISTVAGVITGTVIPAIGAVLAAILPVLPIIAAVAAAIAAVVLIVTHWGEITDWISEKWTLFTDFLMEKVEAIKQFFTEGFALIKETVSTKIEEILETVTGIWESIKESITNAKKKVTEKVQDILGSIKEKFLELKDKALTWGSDMIQNFIDGIKAKWEALKESVIAIGETIKSYLGFSVPEKGPLHQSNEWPRHFMENYSHGLENARYLIQTAVGDISSDMAVLENPIDAAEIYDAVRLGASSASLSLSIGEREFARGLRDMGVVFNG